MINVQYACERVYVFDGTYEENTCILLNRGGGGAGLGSRQIFFRLRLLTFFFQAIPASAPRGQKTAAPALAKAPNYLSSLVKYFFPHKLLMKTARNIITIYDTVISSEREIKFLSREFFYFERFQGFFYGLFGGSNRP